MKRFAERYQNRKR